MGALLDDAPVVTASSTYPELCVEVLFTQGPGAADGDWCDITAYVSDGACDSGRQYELERFGAGNLSLTLKADSRLFDQDWVSGPLYPWLVPMRQVRVSAVWNSVRYAVWRGYITDWGQVTSAADNMLVSTVQARNAFAFMEAQSLPGSWYEAVVSQDRPAHWWKLDETSGTAAADSGFATNLYNGTYANSPTLNDTTLVTYDGGRKGATFDGASQYVEIPAGATEGLTTFSIELWFSSDRGASPLWGTDDDPILWIGSYGADTYIGLAQDTPGGGVYYENIYGYHVSGGYPTSTGHYADGGPHHVVITKTGTSLSTYVDGALVGTNAGSSASGLSTGRFTIGARLSVSGYAVPTNYFAGGIGNVAIYGGVLSATQVAAHYEAGTSAFSGDDSGAILGRVLTAKGWPSTLRDIDAGASMVGAFELPNGLLEFVQRMADTEAGQTYISPAGSLVHRNRQNLWLEARSQTSQATFGDAHSAATLKYVAEGFSLVRDEALIRNPVSASRSGGVTATVSDADKVEKYGERGYAMPVAYDSSDTVMHNRAAYYLTSHKELGTRLASMTVKPVRDPSNLWPQVLGRLIGDRITVKRTTLGTGDEISSEQILEGISHRFTPTEWSTTFRGSPADLTVYWILDDATYSSLGSTTTLAY